MRATTEIARDVLRESPRWGMLARRPGHLVAPAPVNVSVGITGDMAGHLDFGFERDVAKAVAEAMIGDPIPELDTAALGALCEFALLVCGFAAEELRQKGRAIGLTPPLVALGDRVELIWHGLDPLAATMTLALGAAQMSLGVRPEKPAPVALRVLVVDDMKFIRFSLSKMLAERGWQVVGEAENGAQAVEMYQALGPDVVTMDITMPVMDGIEACKAIIAADPDARILMLTAVGQMDKVVEAMHAGAKDFITKPFKKDRVHAGIEGIITGKAPGFGA